MSTVTVTVDGVPVVNYLPDGVGIFGDTYSHCILNVGYGANPLTATHQVAVYSAILGNSYVGDSNGYVIGFETRIGTQPGSFTLPNAVGINLGSVLKGSGTSITRVVGLLAYDDTAGTNNAILATFGDAFTGNWFLNYKGGRQSYVNGKFHFDNDIGVGRMPDAVTDCRTIAIDAASQCFIRIYVGGVEKARITGGAEALAIDSLSGTVEIRGANGTGISVAANGTVKIASLAGSGSRTVKADANGVLSAP